MNLFRNMAVMKERFQSQFFLSGILAALSLVTLLTTRRDPANAKMIVAANCENSGTAI